MGVSSWNRAELEQMLEDVVNELELSDIAIEVHGPLGTPPARLVRLVLNQKDETIRMLRAGMVQIHAREEKAEAELEREKMQNEGLQGWLPRKLAILAALNELPADDAAEKTTGQEG